VREGKKLSSAHRRLASLYLEVAQALREDLSEPASAQCRVRLNEKIAYNEGHASFHTMLARSAERRGK